MEHMLAGEAEGGEEIDGERVAVATASTRAEH